MRKCWFEGRAAFEGRRFRQNLSMDDSGLEKKIKSKDWNSCFIIWQWCPSNNSLSLLWFKRENMGSWFSSLSRRGIHGRTWMSYLEESNSSLFLLVVVENFCHFYSFIAPIWLPVKMDNFPVDAWSYNLFFGCYVEFGLFYNLILTWWYLQI